MDFTGMYAVALLIGMGMGGAQPAAGEDLYGEFQTLFSLGKSVRTAAEAESQFRRLERLSPDDARVYYAYALSLIEKHRYSDAARQINRSLAISQGNLSAWKAKIWLDVTNKQYADAQEAMRSLCGLMPADTTRPEIEARCQETAAFLGRVCGFIQGPGREGGDALLVDRFVSELARQLTPSRLEVFKRARQEVLDQYVQFAQGIQQRRQNAKTAEYQVRSRQNQLLNQERHQVMAEMGTMEDRKTEVRRDYMAEQAQLAQNRQESVGMLGQVGAQAVQAQAAYASTSTAIGQQRWAAGQQFTEPQPPMGNPPSAAQVQAYQEWFARRQQWQQAQAMAGAQADAMEPDRANYAATAQGLGAQAMGLMCEVAEADRQLRESQAREAAEMRRLEFREKRLRVNTRRCSEDEERNLKQPNTGTTTEVLALTNKAKALVTYIPQPISVASEQSRLLTSLLGDSVAGGLAAAANR
jgi:hypothetical protein